VAFSAGGDGGREPPEHPAFVCGSQRLPNNRDSSVHALGIPIDRMPRIGWQAIEPDRGLISTMF
jgi:hypothetical protein